MDKIERLIALPQMKMFDVEFTFRNQLSASDYELTWSIEKEREIDWEQDFGQADAPNSI